MGINEFASKVIRYPAAIGILSRQVESTLGSKLVSYLPSSPMQLGNRPGKTCGLHDQTGLYLPILVNCDWMSRL